MKLISWNLLHRDGAALIDVARLIEQHRPDALLMQEVTTAIEALPRLVGGHYARTPLPGRRHGLAIWTREPTAKPPGVFPLPSGAVVHRICQVIDFGSFSAANVHLSQGQLLNRRQLRSVVSHLPLHAAVLGDYNLVGPPMVPGFRDVGPRQPTHRMSDLVPLRLDRCLIRGLVCLKTDVLERGTSDHRPIMVELVPPGESAGQPIRRPLFRRLKKAVLSYKERTKELSF
jgi:endonuclease/exonuclease/phosphatase (EEP) superfamily protein YafD